MRLTSTKMYNYFTKHSLQMVLVSLVAPVSPGRPQYAIVWVGFSNPSYLTKLQKIYRKFHLWSHISPN